VLCWNHAVRARVPNAASQPQHVAYGHVAEDDVDPFTPDDGLSCATARAVRAIGGACPVWITKVLTPSRPIPDEAVAQQVTMGSKRAIVESEYSGERLPPRRAGPRGDAQHLDPPVRRTIHDEDGPLSWPTRSDSRRASGCGTARYTESVTHLRSAVCRRCSPPGRDRTDFLEDVLSPGAPAKRRPRTHSFAKA
jgi:hypothetical protein